MASITLEKLKSEHAEAARKYESGVARARVFENDANELKTEIARMESSYEDICAKHASGDTAADPSALTADIEKKRHALVGLQKLLREASDAYAPHLEELQVISERILRHEEDDEFDRLKADRINLEKSLADLHKRTSEERIAVQKAMAAEHSHWRKISNRRAAQAR